MQIEAVTTAALRALVPPPRLRLSDWIEAHVELTGHKTLALVQLYTEAAGREDLADSGFEKMLARPNGERNVANLPTRFAKTPHKSLKGKGEK